MFSCSKFEHENKLSAFRYEEPISKDFKVFINGEEASFVNIVSDEEIKIEVIINGVKATKDDFIIEVRDTDNFTFDGEEL